MHSFVKDLHVVFPTPPFPPTNIHFNDRCSRIFTKLCSDVFCSDAIATAAGSGGMGGDKSRNGKRRTGNEETGK